MGRVFTLGLSRAGASAAVGAIATVVSLQPPPLGAVMSTPSFGEPRRSAAEPREGGSAVVSQTGTIRGTVIANNPPAAPAVAVTQDDVVCGRTQPDPSLVVGAGGAVANAVVILSGTKGASAEAASVVNKQCRFVPHVQVAAPGKPLKIGSDDAILHTTHAYAENDRTLFNIALPMAGLSVTRPLEKSKLVRLQCDTHPWMRGYVLVTDERNAITGSDGRFQIDQVPPGTYQVRVWHERLKAAPQKVTVAGGGTAEVAFNVVP